jgi:[protein-PII] uridylyltransferase
MHAENMHALAASLREHCRQQLADLKAGYLVSPDPAKVLADRAQQVDDVLLGLWQAQDFPDSIALIAVGGYGRGELYPCSDVDLLILLPAAADEALQAKLEQLVGLFWDVGLEVGHSVRTIDECLAEAQADITVQTALLESRWLSGNAALYDEFHRRFCAALDRQAFFEAKTAEQQERYLRFNETPYNLEPNCKESPGGLRDLQIIGWLAKAVCGCQRDARWDELGAQSIVTAQEAAQLKQCEHFLRDLRIRLHFHAGRREDRLVFDVQKALAEQMGFEAKNDRRASERMMQAYYKNAKTVTQLNILFLQNIAAELMRSSEQGPPEPIDAAFQISGDQLDIRHDDVFAEDPARILDSFYLLQQHTELRGMTVRTLRALWRERNRIDADFRASPRNRQRFLSILQAPQGIVHAFRRMNEWGILGRYLPAFGRIVGQMQHDLFHVYTVDQHILQVLRNVRRFALEEHAHEYPFEYRLLNAFDRPWVIYIAALFHDIAKGRGGDHSTLGMADAEVFCRDHSLDPADSELVVWLVGQHLTMSQIAQKEDIADPEVIRSFAAKVRDERHLTALYLLTVADIRGTSPKVWNGWKAQLLLSLYQTTLGVLRGGKPPEAHGAIAERQAEAMRLIRLFALPDSVHERLWKQLDTVYFTRHSAEEIAWHTRCLHYRPDSETPIVKARLCRLIDDGDGEHTTHESAGIQVMVYTHDQKDLFLRLAGFFARAGFSIADARIHTTRHGYALDSFVLLDIQERGNDRELISFIEYELTQRLVAQAPPDQPAGGRLSRQVKHFPIRPEVGIRPDDRGSNYILSLTAADRPGLLYSLAATLARHGANLLTAKIVTLGERVEDTFLISGGDLWESANRIKLETELLEQLKV